MSRHVDTADIDLAIQELAVALGLEVEPDHEQGAVRLACAHLSDEFALHPVWGSA